MLLTPEAPNNILIMASFRSILEIHVVYRIVPVCGYLADIDFPLGHFRTQLAYRIFAQALALIWYSPFLLCACCEGGVYSTNDECPVLALVVPWPHYRPESKMIDAYLLINTLSHYTLMEDACCIMVV